MSKRSPVDVALDVVTTRADLAREAAAARWIAALGPQPAMSIDAAATGLRHGRLTLNLHPDRVGRRGVTVAAGLLADGRYRSQWVTGLSNGSRSAFVGGDRHGFERGLFGDAYDDADPELVDLPIYGALDLLDDPFGGSPRFGSTYLVLRPHVLERTTLCVGDSHLAPTDIGTVGSPWCVLAGLAEQARANRLFDRGLGVDALLAVLSGRPVPYVRTRVLDGYVEAQIHGGVDLASDVDAIVVDPSFDGTPVGDDLAITAMHHGIALHRTPGSELAVDDVPVDFRGPAMPGLARQVARPDGIVDARAIGAAAPRALPDPLPAGDPPDSLPQQLKYLWHTVFRFGHDAAATRGRP